MNSFRYTTPWTNNDMSEFYNKEYFMRPEQKIQWYFTCNKS